MALLEVSGLRFRYPDARRETLKNISFSVEAGQFVVLIGPSGCGKTTLLRHLKHDLAPVGERQGIIRYGGIPLDAHPARRLAGEIGFVQQDPENQIAMDQVGSELAFGMENIGLPPAVMRKRLAEICHFFGLDARLDRPTHSLSGGQKQLVNLASVLLLHPRLLLLDEPTAQLDPVAAREFLQMVRRLNEELGVTVIMTEHRLEELFPLADRILMMDEGELKYAGEPREVIHGIWESGDRRLLEYVPSIPKLCLACEKECPEDVRTDASLPLTVKEGRHWLNAGTGRKWLNAVKAGADEHAAADADVPPAGRPLLECRSLFYQYDKDAPFVLNRLSLQVYERDFLAVVGGNGAGKSTLLKAIAGLLQPQRGTVLYRGEKVTKLPSAERYRKIGYLAQNPLLHFIHDTVEEELRHAAERSDAPEAGDGMRRLIAHFGLDPILRSHPYDLSGGERQKTALACVLLSNPELLLIDEPTKGLDPHAKRQLAALLLELHKRGLTIVMVTHDIEFAARTVNRCAMMFDGGITSEGSPALLFGGNYFYTTAVNRMVRGVMPQALIYEEVLRRWNVPVPSLSL